MVLIHGLLLGSLAQWYFTAAPALAAAHRVLMYDLRGHGRSERTVGGYDLRTQRADLEGLLAAFDLHEVDLVGHSYGALIALHFALAHPERVRRLVLVDAPLPPAEAQVYAEAMAHPEDLVQLLPEGTREAFFGGPRRTRRRLESLAFLAGESGLLPALRAEPDLPDADLARIEAPTLLIYGAASRCVASGERLARVLPHATLRTVPGGHFVPIEAPAAMTALVEAFLG